MAYSFVLFVYFVFKKHLKCKCYNAALCPPPPTTKTRVPLDAIIAR